MLVGLLFCFFLLVVVDVAGGWVGERCMEGVRRKCWMDSRGRGEMRWVVRTGLEGMALG